MLNQGRASETRCVTNPGSSDSEARGICATAGCASERCSYLRYICQNGTSPRHRCLLAPPGLAALDLGLETSHVSDALGGYRRGLAALARPPGLAALDLGFETSRVSDALGSYRPSPRPRCARPGVGDKSRLRRSLGGYRRGPTALVSGDVGGSYFRSSG